MGVLLRIAKKTIWSGEPPDDARRRSALASFARRPQDTDGISVYEVESVEERECVVAAIACGRQKDDPIDLLEIPREKLEAYGAVDRTEGTTPLAAANALHRSLNWPHEVLMLLAEDLLLDGAKAVRHQRASVRAAVAKVSLEAVADPDVRDFVRAIRDKVGPRS